MPPVMMSKEFKFSPNRGEYASQGVWLNISSDQIGLCDPTTPAEYHDVVGILSLTLEGQMLTEKAKLGLVSAADIPEKLKPWQPQSSPTPTT